ncbi:DUF305 domain-containing protein [soil metagenome]
MTRRLFTFIVPAMLLVAACGDDDGGSGSEPPVSASDGSALQVNDADVQFAQSMIPHHRQAVEMANIALDPSSEASRDVTRLAGAIKRAQRPEIKTMTTWLESWGEPLDEGAMDPDMSSGTGMGDDMSDDGMMSGEEMSELEDLTGTKFDRRWLKMMIKHHEGAVEMAERECRDGTNPDALELAADIIATQEAEIAEMRELLGS